MGLFGEGGWFNDATSTVNPFDDKNGAFQGSGDRQQVQQADPGRNLGGRYSPINPAPVSTPNPFGTTVGNAVEASIPGYDEAQAKAAKETELGAALGGDLASTGVLDTALGTGYWQDYGDTAMQQAKQQGQQYQDYLNQSGDASWYAGEAANAALQGTGQAAADTGNAAQGALAGLGSQYGSALTNAGQQYAGSMMSAGAAAQNYGTKAAGTAANTADILGNAGGTLLGQGAQAQNRNVSGVQRNALMNLEAQEGPSAAQGQLQQATNANQANALAMARSGRGFGASASAMRQAAQQRVGAQQQAANQSAVLRAQENAAWRQRQAANIGTAGQLATSQAATNDARQAALNQAGLGAMQAGGNLQLGAGQLGLSGYNQNLAAQQGAANTALSGLQAGAQTEIGANQAGYGMALQGLGQQQQAQQAGGALGLQGYGQAGQLYGNAGAYGQNNLTLQGNIEQQGLGWEQQHVQNELTAAGINNGVALQQQAQGNQMMGAYIGAVGSVLPMAAMLSDRNAKEGIEPTNVTLKAEEPTIVTPEPGTISVVPDGYVRDQNGMVQGTITKYNADGSPYHEKVGDPYEAPAVEQGVGISGPNQAQGASSMAASNAAAGAQLGAQSGAPNPGKIDPAKYGGVGKGGNVWQTLGGAIRQAGEASAGDLSVNPITHQSWYNASPYQPYQAPMMGQPMGQMQPITSDEREKEAIKAFDETAGYSYNYKDPEAMGATDGRQFGIMAQDLEKTPAGRSVVKKGPNGTKMVDTSRLALVEGAAINGLLKRIEALEGKKGKAA